MLTTILACIATAGATGGVALLIAGLAANHNAKVRRARAQRRRACQRKLAATLGEETK